MRALRPRTRKIYADALARAAGVRYETLAEYAGAKLHYETWTHAQRLQLKAAVRRAWGEAGDLGRGVTEGDRIQDVEIKPIERRRYALTLDGANKLLGELRDRAAVRAIASIMIVLGLRVDEILSAEHEDVAAALDSKRLRVIRKGGKEEFLPAAKIAAQLRVLLEQRAAAQWGSDVPTAARDWLRVHETIAPHPKTAYNRVLRAIRSAAKRAGVEATPHVLRYTFATLAHRRGVDLLHLRALLGHADLGTTQRYVTLDPSRLADDVSSEGLDL